MIKIFQVNSLPLKEVIEGLAASFEVPFFQKCSEYYLQLPSHIGTGEIRGINFDNGLGIISYKCRFNVDLKIEFTVDNVHPVKYLYAVSGPVSHSFATETVAHIVDQYKCAIVASQERNGHILSFGKNRDIHLISLEIDREKLIASAVCEIKDLTPRLKKLFSDVDAKEAFYHDGFYGLDFKKLLQGLSKFEDRSLIRKLHLESNALDIFVNQIILFEDDILNEGEKTILRTNELSRVESIATFIKNNLRAKHMLDQLAIKAALNQNKLQAGFKYLYDQTVTEFINHNRLIKASILLHNSELSINEIGMEVGLDNPSYFSKVFKKQFGITPKEFKKLQN